MSQYIAYESQSEKELLRQGIREAREEILKKAKAKYEKEEVTRKKEAEFILPSVNQRVTAEEEEMKQLLKKDKKKKKKEKKSKKEKKKHRRNSSSDSDSDSEAVWMEKKVETVVEPKSFGPKLERDSWMSDAFDILPTISNKKEKAEQKVPVIDKPGQHARELNPYWKEGGSGLPGNEVSTSSTQNKSTLSGDGGLSWLKKALQRCHQLAEEEGKSVEEVAAERYESLDSLKKRIEACESARNQSNLKDIRSRFRRPSDDCGRNDYRDKYDPIPRRDTTSKSGGWRKTSSDTATRKTSPPSRGFIKPDEERSDGKRSSEKRSSEKRSSEKRSSEKRSSEKRSDRRHESSVSSLDDKSSSESEEEVEDSKKVEPQTPPRILSEQEKNVLGAKLLKAELLGNETLAKELRKQLDDSRNSEKLKSSSNSSKQNSEDVELLTIWDKRGRCRPAPDRKHPVEPSGGRRKKQKVETHVDGKRTCYFADDNRQSIRELVENERLTTAEDSNVQFARLAGRSTQTKDDDYQLDDEMIENAAKKRSDSLIESRDRQLAVIEQKKMSAKLDKCNFCFNNLPKHLIIAIGVKVCLCLPRHKSMADGHCLIVPMQHVTQSTICDEDVWEEIKIFTKGLTHMFKVAGEDCVFMETCMHLHKFPHMVIECIPMPKETGDLAPIYFKKAIQESDVEWSQNKKLIDLTGKDVKRAIPKGFPYFRVNFGLQEGFAHVIEDERTFPSYFGREVVGGMLELDPTYWRKPHQDSFDEQRQKVLKFSEMWKPYDWTVKLKQ